MRLLSKTERDICQRMLHSGGKGIILGNIIENHLNDVLISFTRDPVHVMILVHNQTEDEINTEDFHRITERINDIELVIITTVSLLNMLEKEGYIIVYRNANHLSDGPYGNGTEPLIRRYFPDKSISELFIDFLDKSIVLTPEFALFCKRGFRARDEFRFQRQSLYTKIAITVAFCVGVTNIGLNFRTVWNGGTKIQQYQIDTLSNGLKIIGTKLDTIGNKMTKIQSLKPATKKQNDNPASNIKVN